MRDTRVILMVLIIGLPALSKVGFWRVRLWFLLLLSPPFGYTCLIEEFFGRRQPKIHRPDSYISVHLGSFEFI